MVEATATSTEEAKALQEASTVATEETAGGDGEQPAKKKKKRNKKKKGQAAADDVGCVDGAPEEEKKESTAAAAQEETKGGDGDGENAEGGDGPAKKKRNKKKKNKGGAGGGVTGQIGQREQDNSVFRLLGNWGPGEWKQTIDYTIPVSQQFPDGNYPMGEIQEHNMDHNNFRISSAEMRAKEGLFESDYKKLRRAAEVHR